MKKLLFLMLAACGLPFAGAVAQITSPMEGVPYVLHDSLGNGKLVLEQTNITGWAARLQTRKKTEERQQWFFEPYDGAYRLKNKATGDYLFLCEDDTWDMTFYTATTLPTNLTKGEYTIEAINSKYVAIKLKQNGKYFGFDSTSPNAILYCDKPITNNGAKWYLEALATDPKSIYTNNFNETGDSINSIFANYETIAGVLSDSLMLINDKYESSTTDDQYTEGSTILANFLDYVNALGDKLTSIKAMLSRMESIINTTSYPGKDALADAYTKYSDLVTTTPGNTLTIDQLSTLIGEMQKAIAIYATSQEATADAPADITLLLQHPWFCNDANVPASNSQDDIVAAGQSTSTLNSTGWVKGSTLTKWGGDDEHSSWREARDCWNAWATNFDGYLDVHQDLDNLPDGFYGITCEAITQKGCLNDQHAYVTSKVQTINSPVMATEGWVNPDDSGLGAWEAMATGKLLVVDGKLSLGFRGSHDASKTSDVASDGRNGWFCVTNFKLQYYGSSTQADLDEAYKKVVAECQAQCDTMKFKGDKATYQQVINEFKTASDRASVLAALDTIAKAKANAITSIAKQVEVITGACQAVKDSIAAGVYDEAYTPIMQGALDAANAIINAEGQTYACSDSITKCLKALRVDYVNEYVKALQTIQTYAQQSSRDVVTKTIEDELTYMRGVLLSPTTIAAYIAKIEAALADAAANELVAKGGTDYTAMIANPICTSSAKTTAPTGWTVGMINSANNQYCNTGHQYDGDANGYYMDAWNGTPKKILYNAHQTIKNLPNGTYTLKAMARHDGAVGKEGVYVYAIADNDSTTTALALVKREQCNITTATQGVVKAASGADSLLYVTDTYGSIWEAAATATNYGASTTASELDMAIYGANSNAGRGWHYIEVPITVKNHLLTIGFTNDSTWTLGHKDLDGNNCIAFTGTWLSCDTWTLIQTAAGDNSNWSPVTGITTTKATNRLIVEVRNGRIVTNKNSMVYNINGQLVNARGILQNGIYVVRSGKQSVKVVVK
jgi:hypothetical protein